LDGTLQRFLFLFDLLDEIVAGVYAEFVALSVELLFQALNLVVQTLKFGLLGLQLFVERFKIPLAFVAGKNGPFNIDGANLGAGSSRDRIGCAASRRGAGSGGQWFCAAGGRSAAGLGQCGHGQGNKNDQENTRELACHEVDFELLKISIPEFESDSFLTDLDRLGPKGRPERAAEREWRAKPPNAGSRQRVATRQRSIFRV